MKICQCEFEQLTQLAIFERSVSTKIYLTSFKLAYYPNCPLSSIPTLSAIPPSFCWNKKTKDLCKYFFTLNQTIHTVLRKEHLLYRFKHQNLRRLKSDVIKWCIIFFCTAVVIFLINKKYSNVGMICYNVNNMLWKRNFMAAIPKRLIIFVFKFVYHIIYGTVHLNAELNDDILLRCWVFNFLGKNTYRR